MSVSNDNSTVVTLTNEQLIAKVISTLECDDKTDASLLKVLSEHILKIKSTSSAINDAVNEIEALAKKRAEEAEDAPRDHD